MGRNAEQINMEIMHATEGDTSSRAEQFSCLLDPSHRRRCPTCRAAERPTRGHKTGNKSPKFDVCRGMIEEQNDDGQE